MYIFPIVAFFGALPLVFAYPSKRSVAADIQVLAFASMLEHMESAFYSQALQQFSPSNFEAAGFASSQIPIQQIQAIANDENIHAMALQSAIDALGGQVTSNCTFDFSTALADVNTMVATARVIEYVGISAYLGALSALTDRTLITPIAGIMTVEARHQTILNLLSNATSIPQPFDIALTPAEVLAIADTFISGCELGFSANPPLTVMNSSPLQPGTKFNFSSPALNGTTSSQLSCKIVTGGSNVSVYQPADGCMIPANVTGPMYVFITKDPTATSSSETNARMGSSEVVAGPALLFVNQPDLIGSLIRPGLNATGGTATANPTTSPPTTSTPTATMSTLPSTVPSTTSISGTPSVTPMPGLYTTLLSPAQASAVISSLIN